MLIFTIGAYGFDRNTFLNTIRDADIDVFVDIRQRAGMRGSKYAFLNKRRLQQSIQDLGKIYWHTRNLAPTSEIRELQKHQDISRSVSKRHRENLSREFIDAYRHKVLKATFNIDEFCNALEKVGAKRVVFFCVEQKPTACHRSIAATYIADYFGTEVKDLLVP